MKILVAGLTPADQKTLVFDDLRLDRVNRATEVHWSLSGKPVNVAIGIARLGGAESVLVTQLGGERFERFTGELVRLGVDARLVRSRTPTRCCTTLIDRASGSVTELVENSPPMAETELTEFMSLFRSELPSAETVVFSGTLTKSCPTDIYARLSVSEKPKVIADLQGEPLLRLLPCRPFLVKPNREELAGTLDREITTDRSLLEAMRELNRQGARWVLVTDGPRAVWLSSEAESFRFQPITVSKSELVNPIGCGDSLTAALAWSLHRGDEVIQAVRLGIAASTANLKQMLPARLDRDEIVEMFPRVAFEKVEPDVGIEVEFLSDA